MRNNAPQPKPQLNLVNSNIFQVISSRIDPKIWSWFYNLLVFARTVHSQGTLGEWHNRRFMCFLSLYNSMDWTFLHYICGCDVNGNFLSFGVFCLQSVLGFWVQPWNYACKWMANIVFCSLDALCRCLPSTLTEQLIVMVLPWVMLIISAQSNGGLAILEQLETMGKHISKHARGMQEAVQWSREKSNELVSSQHIDVLRREGQWVQL